MHFYINVQVCCSICCNSFQVDHTIIAYLLNPKGEFVEYFGKNKTYDTLVYEIKEYMKKYAVFED